MQKLLRRVRTAERVAAKRKTKRERQYFLKERAEEKDDVGMQLREARADINRAKKAVRDDWNLGPLAPNVYEGQNGDTYGVVSETRYRMHARLKEYQREARCKWMGSSRRLNVVEGDRVVLLEGPDKGKIGKVQRVNWENCDVVVEGLNKANINIPLAMRTGETPPAYNLELPIPLSAVRLVHPIRDPKTGLTRDVIINQLRVLGVFRDHATGKEKWNRVVPSLNLAIPWPEKEPKEAVEHKADTLRIDVEEKTFVPTLLQPPMPEQVIDELRNKYSRFRTRHTPEYLAKLEAEDQAKKDRQKLTESMRTPLQELHRAERERKKKKGKPRLTQEMLEEIGRVMAKNRRLAPDALLLADANSTGEAIEGLSLDPGSETPETLPPAAP